VFGASGVRTTGCERLRSLPLPFFFSYMAALGVVGADGDGSAVLTWLRLVWLVLMGDADGLGGDREDRM
jgi:hypothetical protein